MLIYTMVDESAITFSLWVVILRIALWLAGATGLWVGGRFIAKIPKATFWRSLLTYFLAAMASFVLSWIFLAGWWYLSRDLNISGIWPALAVGLANLFIVWFIIKAMFGASLKKVILAWLPTLAVLAITIPLGMTFLPPSLWQQSGIIISHETTRLLSPVHADGTINYLATVDAKYSNGVTSENNAAILLIKAAGHESGFPEEIKNQLFKRLGIFPLPAKGDYFIKHKDYVSARNLDAEQKDIRELLDKAMDAPWSAKDYPILAGWLKSNAKPLSLVVAASKLPRHYVPMISPDDPPQLRTSYVLGVVQLHWQQGRALIARAMLKLDSDDIDGAWADIQAVRRLVRLSCQETTCMYYLSGTILESLACRGVTAIATSGKLSASQARVFLADIRNMPLLPDTIGGIENERLATLEIVIFLARLDNSKTSEISDDYVQEFVIPDIVKLIGEFPLSQVDWNETLRTLNFWYDRRVAIDHKKKFIERQKAYAEFCRDFEKTQERYGEILKRYKDFSFTKRALFKLVVPGAMRSEIGRAIGITTLFPVLYPLSRYYTATMRSRMSHVAMALAAYRAEQGCFPKALAELCPKYFDTLPENLFTDKPLDYRREGKGYVLYSSGPDNDEDFSVRIVFPASK